MICLSFLCVFVGVEIFVQGDKGHSLSTKNIPNSEYLSLSNLYYALNGPQWSWINDSATIPWNFSNQNANPCSDHWQGLYCNYLISPTYCFIEQIDLQKHNLSGIFPESFAGFPYLTDLLVSSNNISGTIPEILFQNLTRLRSLAVNSNQLYGSISKHINRLSSLQQLHLQSNFFNGTLPLSLFQLKDLEVLWLSYNHFFGSIPNEIGNLSNLLELSLSMNDFTGTIPASIGNLTRVSYLEIKFNHLRGSIPSSIGLLANISQLSFTSNNLTQRIPEEMCNLTTLTSLNLVDNKLTGSIPVCLGSMPELFQMFLNGNQLFGSISSSFFGSEIRKLNVFSVGSNLLTGQLPRSIQNLTEKLEYLDLSRNTFSGIFPIEIFQDFPYFRIFTVNLNLFHGSLPNALNASKYIIDFNIGENSFTGPIPVGHWKLISTYLAFNSFFSSTIPSLFLNCSRLYYFEVSSNALTGTVPSYIGDLKALNYFNVTLNYLTGRLNYTLSDLNQNPPLQQFAVSYNDLTGTIPPYLGRAELVDLILNNNRFTGTVPATFRDLNELQVLFLQNNQLEGDISSIRILILENLDVSNNQLTGTLPDFHTVFPSLKTFAASSNCITGSIPESYCISSVTVLSLDGVSSATNCRTDIFPNSQVLNAFYISTYLRHGIPTCLFSMPHLETLHLSGNGLTGSLPTNLNISESLVDLSLSHNQLTGTIPLVIQERYWQNLDLSYNKLTGTLSDHFHSYEESSSLSLQINRLSGSIPSVLSNAPSIKLLTGNLFACNVDRSDLPQNDPAFDTYSCGSDAVNATIYLWMGVCFLYAIVLYFCIRTARVLFPRFSAKLTSPASGRDLENPASGKEVSSSSSLSRKTFSSTALVDSYHDMIERLYLWRDKIVNFNDPDENVQTAIKSIRYFFEPLRRFVVLISAIIVILIGGEYIGLSVQFDEYQYSYAWSYSAVFLTGSTPALAILVALILLLLLTIFCYQLMVENPSALVTGDYRISKRFRLFLQRIQKVKNQEQLFIYVVLTIIGIFNFILMIIVDIAYVDIILNYSTTVIIFTEIFVAIFKLWFNNVLLWKMIPLARRYFVKYFQLKQHSVPDQDALSQNSAASDHSSSSLSVSLSSLHHISISAYPYSSTELLFIMVTVTFNNVFFPILAIFIVNPGCFYNALFAASEEKTTYSYTICHRTSNIASTCISDVTLQEESSYTPPFIYGYQCASNLLVNYASVFIIMYTWEGFLSPLLKITAKYLLNRLFTVATLEECEREVKNRNTNASTITENTKSEVRSNRSTSLLISVKNIAESAFNKSGWLHRILIHLIPDNLKDLTPNPPFLSNNDENQATKRKRKPVIFFDKNRIAVKINSGIVVLLSFGALFPPLAFIVGTALINYTLYEEIVIGRLLYESERLGYEWYKRQLERDCYGISDSLKYTLWSVIPISSLLYAYIIFDTWGDERGWDSAIPATVLMAVLPVLVLLFVKYLPSFLQYFSKIESTNEAPTDPPRGNTLASDRSSQEETGVITESKDAETGIDSDVKKEQEDNEAISSVDLELHQRSLPPVPSTLAETLNPLASPLSL